MGHHELRPGQLEEAKANAQALRTKGWFLSSVPSFEVWCAATCYDPSQKDGGQTFQQMMFWTLSQNPVHVQNPRFTFATSGLAAFKEHAKPETARGKPRTPDHLQRVTLPIDDVYAPVGADDGVQLVKKNMNWAGKTGFLHTTTTKYTYLFNSDEYVQLHSPTGFRPMGQMQWYASAGLSIQNYADRCTYNSNTRTFFMGIGKDQQGGCMSLGNRLAAYFGLYYYPEADDADFNWYTHVKRLDKDRYIRMRMVNPAYIIKGSKLYVREPTVLREDGKIKPGYLSDGKDDGFQFPRLEKPAVRRGLCWDVLVAAFKKGKNPGFAEASPTEQEGTKSWMAPWIGQRVDNEMATLKTELGDNDRFFAVQATDFDFVQNQAEQWLELLPPKFKGRVHKPESGLFYGWSFPAAMWEYPHFQGDKVVKTLVGKDMEKLDKAWQPKYQPWPTLRDGMTLEKVTQTEFAIDKPLVQVLQKAPNYTLNDRRRFALGMSYERVAGDTMKAYVKVLRQFLMEGTVQLPTPPPAAPPQTAQQDEEDAPEGLLVPLTAEEQEEFGPGTADANVGLGAEDMLEENPMWVSLAEGDLDVLAAETSAKRDDTVLELLPKVKEPLAAGSPRRAGDNEGNVHFHSLQFSPWKPDDVYYEPVHGFEVTKPMNQAAIDEYFERYQNVSNTLLRSQKPMQLTRKKEETMGLERILSNGLTVLEMPLSAYHAKYSKTKYKINAEEKDMFRANMRRILAIYFDQSGELGVGAHKISTQDKRNGMLNGIYRYGEQILYKSRKGAKPLLPKVFETAPDKLVDKKKLVDGNGQMRRLKGTRNSESNAYDAVNVNSIVSKMTVVEWLQTPWHYEYLPFQPMTSVFNDGETYCNGCTRCSRPFFDYKYLYAAYVNTPNVCRHWVHMYWDKGGEDKGGEDAPVPFHDPDFWSTNEVMVGRPADNVAAARDDAGKDVEHGKGYHNWPTKLFLLGYLDGERLTKSTTGTTKGRVNEAEILRGEWLKRIQKKEKLDELFKLWRASQPTYWTFRQYLSHTYSKDRNLYELTQGVVRPDTVRIKYGMQKYKLMRSIKYGNVCRDCMSVLDNAPFLYKRTGGVSEKVALRAGYGPKGQQMKKSLVDLYWVRLAGKPIDDQGNVFDPWFIFLQTPVPSKRPIDAMGVNREYTFNQLVEGNMLRTADRQKAIDLTQTYYAEGKEQAYLDAFGDRLGIKRSNRKETKKEKEAKEKVLYDYINKHVDKVIELNEAKCPMQDADLLDITKVIKPAEVYVQKMWDTNSADWNKKQAEQMKAASAVLKKMIDWLDGAYAGRATAQTPEAKKHKVTPDKQTLTLAYADHNGHNRALRDALYDTLYTLGHKSAYKREPSATKFDPDRTRTEERDATVKGVKHCLMIKEDLTPRINTTLYVDGTDDDGNPQIQRTNEQQKNNDDPLLTICTPRAWEKTKTPAEREQWVEDVKGLYENKKYVKVVLNSGWDGDPFVQKEDVIGEEERMARNPVQTRQLTQSRLFITYSLHRRVFSELEARAVLEKMADAVRYTFGNDSELCDFVIFGRKLASEGKGLDSVSLKKYEPILKPNKKEKVFYGLASAKGSSYLYDTYQTHIESVTVDAGVEIGPTYHHPHFHVLVTLNHFSYVQIDTMHMKAKLEQLFKGTRNDMSAEQRAKFELVDGRGLPFYTDNENAYTDIRVYPSDNWADVIAAYVRKGSDKESMMSLRTRTEKTTVVL